MFTDPVFRIGVTGHRAAHVAWAQNGAAIQASLRAIMEVIASRCSQPNAVHAPRHQLELVTLLADGADAAAAHIAKSFSMRVCGVLPFGRELTSALAAAGAVADAHADVTFAYEDASTILALSESDASVVAARDAAAPGDAVLKARFDDITSRKFASAAQVMIGQSDIVIAVWDGVTRALTGGTGHTIAAALESDVPVVLIPALTPHAWRVLRTPGDLFEMPQPAASGAADDLRQLVDALLLPGEEARKDHRGARDASGPVGWLERLPLWRFYAFLVRVLGGAETPATRLLHPGHAKGSAADAPALDARLQPVEHAFARIDANATHLSHAYRGSMTLNFVLSLLAVVLAVVSLPFTGLVPKWVFSGAELVILTTIMLIVAFGVSRKWHRRWFAARRTAELVRHGLFLQPLAAMRPFAQWAYGQSGRVPEWRALQLLRAAGLPEGALDGPRMRASLEHLLAHVLDQAAYHRKKSAQLERAQASLDLISNAGFLAAALIALCYLIFGAGFDPKSGAAGLFTFFAVAAPMAASTAAAIRYFADLSRFAEISRAAEKQLRVAARDMQKTLSGGNLDHARAMQLARDAERALISELEAWQALFAGKSISLPV